MFSTFICINRRVTAPEYEEAKQVLKTKYGGARQLHGSTRRDGTLHSLLLKKLPEHQLQKYSRWLNKHAREKSVVAVRDWLKDKVRFRVEAAEMVNGIKSKPVEYARPPRAPRY